MAAAEEKDDLKSGLRTLVPVSVLSEEKFAELAAATRIEEAESGTQLFKEGDTDPRAVYLLAGKVAMMSGKSIADTIVGGTEHARYPLAHHLPRQLTALAKTAVSYVRLDTRMLDTLLNSGAQQQNAYEVTEVLEEDDSDWMSQMLQSEAFSSLPAQNIQALFMHMEEVPVSSGDDIVRQGDKGKYFFIIRRGRCKVMVEKNNKKKVVVELSAGDSFGEEALIADTPRSATITMLTDGVLMRLSRDNFDKLMKEPLISWVTYDEATDIIKQGGVWLDVRLPNEHKTSGIKGSHNFPLSVLRGNARRLKTSRKYVAYCDNGKRSSIAAFLLCQRGFDAYVLAGGYRKEKTDSQQPVAAAKASSAKAETTVVDIRPTQAMPPAKAEVTKAEPVPADTTEKQEVEKATRHAKVEAELAQLKLEQKKAKALAESETEKRLKAEAAVAKLKEEQEVARVKAEEEIRKRKEVEAEAKRIKKEAKAACKKAEQEAAKLKAERETLREKAKHELVALREQREAAEKQATARAAKFKEEAEAARMIAAEQASRLKEEAETARKAAEEDAKRIRQEADDARKQAAAETERLQKEHEDLRQKAASDAQRLRAEAEQVKVAAEEEARKRSEEIASEIVAEAEAVKLEAEQESLRLLAEVESVRLQAEAESATFLSSQQEAKLKAEQEVARLKAEAETARSKAEEEQQKMREVEAARLMIEEEASRHKAEAEEEAARIKEEADQRQDEAESTRLQAEEEAARIKAEAEAARLKAQEEAARLSVEVEKTRMDEKNEDAESVVQLESEAEAARLEADEALRIREEAELARLEAEKSAAMVKQEAEQARKQAEDEARQLIESAEARRRQAEEEAEQARKTAEIARQQAEQEVARLAEKAQAARKQAETDAQRLQEEARSAQQRADAVIEKMKADVEALKQNAQQAASATPDEPAIDGAVLEQVNITEIPPLAGDDESDEGDILIIGNESQFDGKDDFVVVPPSFVDGQDDIERFINEAVEEPESVFVSQFTEQVIASQAEPDDTRKRRLIIAGGGFAAIIVVAMVVFLMGDEPPKVAVIEPGTVPPAVIQVQPTSEPGPKPGVVAKPTPKPVVKVEPKPAVVAKPTPKPVVKVEPKPAVVAKLAPTIVAKPVVVRDALKSGGAAPSMVLIPGGTFSMGSPSSSTDFDERPQHKVTISKFAISRYEVTTGDYRKYLRATGGNNNKAVAGRKANAPVSHVSWTDAVKYTKWLSKQTGRKYRLPSEAEWEYAALASVGTRFPWGDEIGKNQATCFDCGSKWDTISPAPVGSFAANPFGLYDVTGNVMEWTQDCVSQNYNAAPTDGSARQRPACTAHIVRGGAYDSPSESLRLKGRSSHPTDTQLDNIGIRLVRE